MLDLLDITKQDGIIFVGTLLCNIEKPLAIYVESSFLPKELQGQHLKTYLQSIVQ